MTDQADFRVDGDLLKDIITDACPDWMADHAASELAEHVLAGCARSGYFTVTRGPESRVWSPDHA